MLPRGGVFVSNESVEFEHLPTSDVKMDIVVDIQGMRGKDSEFIPKEIAVVAVDRPYSAHWIIAPPCHFAELPQNSRSQNNFLSKIYHGLEWFEGDVSCKQVYANLREISRNSRRIYTRGHDKAILLRDVMSRDILNLEDEVGAPSYTFMPKSYRKCFRHGLIKDTSSSISSTHCAMRQAFQIKNWLREHPFKGESYKDVWSADEEEKEEKTSLSGHDTIDDSAR